MNTFLARAAVALVAAAALLLGALTAAASAVAAPTVPPVPILGDDAPSIVQLCAATGDDSIDTLLDGVADTELVGALAPLIGLTVPTDQGRVLRAGVDIDDVREALDCPAAPTPSTQPSTPTTAPTDDAPTSPSSVPTNDGGQALDPTADDGSTPDTSGAQVVEVPEGSASTGA